MAQIIPAILTSDFSDFTRQARCLADISDLCQIDVMDGEMVSGMSFPEREEINTLALPTKWELHLMVNHPLDELERWDKVKNIQRVIFHIESLDSPSAVIAKIRGRCESVGLAINPETPLEKILPFTPMVDEVLFMTVHPGQQGATFVPEVETKIRAYALSRGGKGPLIAVDGAINAVNIATVRGWGVDVFCVGSAITLADDAKAALAGLKTALGENN